MNTNPKENEWRTEHLAHRIRAALDNSSLLQEVLTTHDAEHYNREASLSLCGDQARHEGQIAALRWLIDFVGINAKDDQDLTPKRPNNWPTSESVEKFGGLPRFPLEGDDAKFLARVWKACTQATAHPTSGTNHEPLTEKTRRRALEIVLGHLQSTIYANAGDDWRNYVKVVAMETIAPGRATVKTLLHKPQNS